MWSCRLGKNVFARLLGGVGGLLLLGPALAQAKSRIEFADGHRMTVSSYKQEGQKVTIYTPHGSFAVRRDEIVRITEMKTNQKKRPAEMPARSTQTMRKSAARSKPHLTEKISALEAATQRRIQQKMREPGFALLMETGLSVLPYAIAVLAFIWGLKMLLPASQR